MPCFNKRCLLENKLLLTDKLKRWARCYTVQVCMSQTVKIQMSFISYCVLRLYIQFASRE